MPAPTEFVSKGLRSGPVAVHAAAKGGRDAMATQTDSIPTDSIPDHVPPELVFKRRFRGLHHRVARSVPPPRRIARRARHLLGQALVEGHGRRLCGLAADPRSLDARSADRHRTVRQRRRTAFDHRPRPAADPARTQPAAPAALPQGARAVLQAERDRRARYDDPRDLRPAHCRVRGQERLRVHPRLRRQVPDRRYSST